MKWLWIFLAVFLSGCLLTPNVYRHGFDENDVIAPMPYTSLLEKKPEARALFSPSPVYNLSWSFNGLYANYMGAARVEVKNIGSINIFIYNIAIDIDGAVQKWKLSNDDGKRVNKGDMQSFIFSFKCPQEGRHKYKIGLYVLSENRNKKWHDCGCEWTSQREMNISGYKPATNYKMQKNYYVYYDKIKKLVDEDPNPAIVIQKTEEATTGYGNNYNIAKVCAIFDFIKSNVKYVEDPDNKDIWNSPSIALVQGGDCEEFAMTMAAMVKDAGGTARIYIADAPDNHAFASVYIGKDLSLLESIDSYYHANLNYALFKDNFGYWLVADPLSSFYLGGLPVGGYVTSIDGKTYQWSIETNKLYAIDVI